MPVTDTAGWRATRFYTIPEFYFAICSAETGGEKNPWIRTRCKPYRNEQGKWIGSSTAYGPAQVTGTLVRDFVSRYPRQFHHMDKFIKSYLTQADLFVKHGMNQEDPEYDENFDYGGKGFIAQGAGRRWYQAMTQRIMDLQEKEELAHLGKTPDPHKLLCRKVARWCGRKEADASAYYARVFLYLQQTDALR